MRAVQNIAGENRAGRQTTAVVVCPQAVAGVVDDMVVVVVVTNGVVVRTCEPQPQAVARRSWTTSSCERSPPAMVVNGDLLRWTGGLGLG